MNILSNLLTVNKYSRPGTKLTKVTKIAIHYVGNAGSSAIGNRNYFESLKDGKKDKNGNYIYASSHYIIGLNGEIICCVPENEIAYCTNSANSYSISIENCHPLADGKFNDKTNNSLIELCADLCKRYNLNPEKDMIRHYDVTGKMCPYYHVKYPSEWDKLKKDVAAFMAAQNPLPVQNEETWAVEKRTININGQDFVFDVIVLEGSSFVRLRGFEGAGYAISYDTATKKATMNLKPVLKEYDVNGSVVEMETLFLEGFNYIKLRELEKLGLNVLYDPVNNRPVLENQKIL